MSLAARAESLEAECIFQHGCAKTLTEMIRSEIYKAGGGPEVKFDLYYVSGSGFPPKGAQGDENQMHPSLWHLCPPIDTSISAASRT